jgi:hypothetical protein
MDGWLLELSIADACVASYRDLTAPPLAQVSRRSRWGVALVVVGALLWLWQTLLFNPSMAAVRPCL